MDIAPRRAGGDQVLAPIIGANDHRAARSREARSRFCFAARVLLSCALGQRQGSWHGGGYISAGGTGITVAAGRAAGAGVRRGRLGDDRRARRRQDARPAVWQLAVCLGRGHRHHADQPDGRVLPRRGAVVPQAPTRTGVLVPAGGRAFDHSDAADRARADDDARRHGHDSRDPAADLAVPVPAAVAAGGHHAADHLGAGQRWHFRWCWSSSYCLAPRRRRIPT